MHTRDLWGDEWVRAWFDGEGDDDPAVADAVDISFRHVRRVLGELDEAGDLDREHTGLGRANVYDPVAQPGAATADDIDGRFSDDDIEAWMETAVDPIESETEQDDEEP